MKYKTEHQFESSNMKKLQQIENLERSTNWFISRVGILVTLTNLNLGIKNINLVIKDLKFEC